MKNNWLIRIMYSKLNSFTVLWEIYAENKDRRCAKQIFKSTL